MGFPKLHVFVRWMRSDSVMVFNRVWLQPDQKGRGVVSLLAILHGFWLLEIQLGKS